MASAILTNRNDPRSTDFITKFTNNNSNVNFMNSHNIQNPNFNQYPYSTPSQPAFIRSSINSVPANSNGYRYITFRLSSYSKRELKQLKNRLISDLERVRVIRQWICSTSIPKTNHRFELPAAPLIEEPQKRRVGRKRRNHLPPVRDTKMMRQCGQILSKLMKHKNSWVFNAPVDAVALKLYDYHNIINKPMDLGTIKSKLAKNEYESPLAFASDVRLTFQNAMVYNGEGSDVFVMAERLLLVFEGMFDSSYNRKFVVKKQNRSVSVPVSVVGKVNVRVTKKREMTVEEKSELAGWFSNLQLGPEGMDEIMAIVKKGVLGLEHQGDEIELDLAVLDNDTLWELHTFIRKVLGNEHVVEEEDVDIGDERQATVCHPTVEIEKDVVHVGSSDSCSSSSDSG
ncbi:hypothetical protein QVD17_04875 [Tagetes erecta]|uniref:Uncharacterized protein n=1 Tax=Tagetes erecta TaxID=13708 RepID=A0AAD8LKD7_TARER|nr:hypothetical protein QVD17_04875 [Tagetes erecta]